MQKQGKRRRSSEAKGLQTLEPRLMLAAGYRSIDGSGNNLAHPEWGTPGQPLQRVSPVAYGDGISTPAGASRMSAREVSNWILHHAQSEDIFNKEGMAAFVYAWGQFIDHDMDLTNNATPSEPFNIPVPIGDQFFDPDFTGTQVIGLNRSKTAAGTGTSAANPRQQPNAVTAFIDGSAIYGSDPVRAAWLRTGQNGLLKTTDSGQQMPYNTAGFENQAFGPAEMFFLAGDVRSNENSELTSLHVLFVREHNRIAGLLKQKHSNWNDETLYQNARRLVIGELQNITFNEFLPSFLGKNPLPAYTGYKSNVNAQIATEFSTAAFRFGHTILGDDVQFFDDVCDTPLPDLKLQQTFFAPDQQLNGGTDGLLKYLASVSSQEVDAPLVQGIRNFLFGQPGQGGFDLGALDIQRGRDHGIADYNTVREALGLPRITSFAQLSSNVSFQQTLEFVYGSVDNIDLFVAGLCEPHADAAGAGPAIGETFARIIANQFQRSRDGDRYWFESDLDTQELKFVRKMTLSEIMLANTTITNLQANAFQFDLQITGRVFNDVNGNGRMERGEQPITDQFVYMDDGDSISDWQRTDSQGKFAFTRIQVGEYTSYFLPQGGWVLTTPDYDPFLFTKHQQFHNVNFGVRLASTVANNTSADQSLAQVSQTQNAAATIDASKLVDGKFSDVLI